MRINPRWFRAFVSLLLASLLWLSMKVVKPTSVSVEVPLAYKNIPAGLSFNRQLPAEVRVGLQGEGHMMLLPSIMGADSLAVDVQPYLSRGYMPAEALAPLLSERYPEAMEIEFIVPDTLYLEARRQATRKVPVWMRARLHPAPGHILVEAPRFRPDSVSLTGSPEYLANIESWPTVDTLIHGFLGAGQFRLSLLQSSDVAIAPTWGKLWVQTKRYTETELWVDVEPINLPVRATVRLLPKRVKVLCLVPFDGPEAIRLSDFRVVADFNKIPQNAELIIPEVLNAPEGVMGIRLSPPYIRYVFTLHSNPY